MWSLVYDINIFYFYAKKKKIFTWTSNTALKPIFKYPWLSLLNIRINDCLKIAVVNESDKII